MDLVEHDFARDFSRGATDTDYFFDFFGGGERWIKGDTEAKDAANQDNPWYYILPTGDLFEWDGTDGLNGTLVGTLSTDAYDNPNLLTDAYADGTLFNNVAYDPFNGPANTNDPKGEGDALNDGGLDMDFGGDFNPVTGNFHLVSVNNQNLFFDPAVGRTTVGPDVNPGSAQLAALGFTGNFANPFTSAAFAIDSLNPDTLNTFDPATGTTAVRVR